MDFFNFNPPNLAIEIFKKGKTKHYELANVTIKVLCKIQRYLGDFKNFRDTLNIASKNIYNADFARLVVWLTHQLLIDKSFTLSNFSKIYLDQKSNIYQKNVTILFAIIEQSQPKLDDIDIKKESDIDAFTKCYAFISREINYTIDQFYNLTLRQVYQLQNDIIELKNQDYQFQASLHGIKLPYIKNQTKSSFSKKEDAELTKYAEQRLKDLRNDRSQTYPPQQKI